MPRKRYSVEQIINHLREADVWLAQGRTVGEVCRHIGASCIRLRPCWPNHVWSYDFVMDRTHDGKRFRMLTVIDEFTKESLAIVVARRLRSDDVLHARPAGSHSIR